MLKKYIQTFTFCFLFSITFALNVNATNLDIVEPGDIIIGNTVFRSDDWISATRSSKAGALYYENTGETDVRVFYYDDFGDWYEYNDLTSKYELITEPTLSELGDIINIYYDNNEPLTMTYMSIYEIVYDEETGETALVNANDVGYLFNDLAQYGEIMYNDEEVILDYNNQIITCPYGKEFEFLVVSNNIEDTFSGYCGKDFYYGYVENQPIPPEYPEKVRISSIELANDENLLNQSKVTLTNPYETNTHKLLTITKELEKFNIMPHNYPGEATPVYEGNFVVIDIKFIGNNNCNNYSITNTGYINIAYFSSCIDNNTMRLYLDLDSYNTNGFSFILLDRLFTAYQQFSIEVDALEKPIYNPEVSLRELKIENDITPNNSIIVNNEIKKDEFERKYIFVNAIGELEETTYDNISGKWIAVDFILNDGINYENCYFSTGYDTDKYEVLENGVRFYLDMNNTERRDIHISDYMTTNSNNYLDYNLVFNIYNEEMSIKNYTNSFGGEYSISTTENGLEIKKKELSDYSYGRFFVYNNILYFKDFSNFMEDGVLKTISKERDKENPEIINYKTVEKEYELIIKSKEGNVYYTSLQSLDNSYETIIRDLNEEYTDSVYFYTFFAPDRVLTEEEQAEFEKFNSQEFVETYGERFHLVDISSSVYETE